MKRFVLYNILTLLGLLSLNAAKIESHKGEIANGYDYLLALPDDTVGQKPVVIFLHGASLCGRNLDRVKRYGTIDAIQKGRQIDAYVIAPQNPGGAWKPNKILDVLNTVSNNHNIDSNRVYVLGMSLGGYGTMDMAATYPDRIAAAVAICGGITVDSIINLRQVPLWIIHGTADRAVSVKQSDRVVDQLKNHDSIQVRYIYDRLPGVNHSQPARVLYMTEVYDWLFRHNLAEENRPAHETTPINNATLRNAYQGLHRTR